MIPGERTALRRKATVVHWIAQLYVLALILLTVFGMRQLGKQQNEVRLASAATATMDAFWAFDKARQIHLTTFLPPADSAARTAWAVRIQEHLGQRAAVFLQQGRQISWLSGPGELQGAVAQAQRRLLPQPGDTTRGSVDSLGAMLIEVHGLESGPADSAAGQLWVVGPLGDSLRWGIVLSWYDSWRSFFKDLDRAPAAYRFPVSRLTRHFLQVEGGRYTFRTGLRALLDGEQIYATPGVDTARPVYRSELRRLVLEFYQSRADAVNSAFIGYPLRWSRLLMYLVFMLLFFLYYRWVRRLTDSVPEAPPTPSVTQP